MRLLLAALALCLSAACSGQKATEGAPQPDQTENIADANDEAVGGTGGEEKTIDDLRAESLAAIDQEACRADGGEVRQEGMLGMYRCVKPYADAGKECRSNSDCEGMCLSTGDALVGEEATGTCQVNDSPFGCYAEVEDGKVTDAICVD